MIVVKFTDSSSKIHQILCYSHFFASSSDLYLKVDDENIQICYGYPVSTSVYSSNLLVSQEIPIKGLIYRYILYVLSFCNFSGEFVPIASRKFPLYKGTDDSRVLYISGLALQLAKSDHDKTMDIANGIVSHLSAMGDGVFQVEVVPPGWIHLELTHAFLAAWLQNLVVKSVGEDGEREKAKITMLNPSSLFMIQYAHARCCSLVRLAHHEGLIKLKEVHQPDLTSLVSVEKIPWLNDEQKLRFTHPAEGRLITELVEAVDNLECSGTVNWEKVALDLSRAFEAFWCRCRILGEVKITSLELAQARVGLIMATQSVLRCLLVDKLGVFAPLEL